MKWILLLIVLLCMGYLYMLCPRMSFRKRMYAYHGLMFAHRGYHNADHGIPENSMPAFQKAIAKGYGIELDLHLTADGELVVFHDDTLTRMCGRDDVIESMTSKELTRCRLLNTRETIPLFRDVLALVDGQVPLLIELKIPSHSMDICEETYLQLQSYTGSYMIQSFNTMGLKWFRTHAPHVLRGQLSSNLTRSHKENSWLLRFVVKHLLCNAIGRPDFISYKLHDLPSPGVWILKNIFRAPIAVWTLRTPKALRTGKAKYDIQIFENQYEN